MKKNLYRFFILLKYSLISLFKLPIVYFSVFFFLSVASIYYFNINHFFTPNGSTDLTLFFNVFPIILILITPSIVFSKNQDILLYEMLPISNQSKIICKLLSILITLLFITFSSIIVPIFVSFFGIVQISKCFACYLNLLFFLSSIISISLFIQEIVKKQNFAFLLTEIVLLLFATINFIPDLLSISNKNIISLINYLSFSWHFNAATKGIINFSDLSFYLFITIIFILLTEIVQNHKIERKNKRSIYLSVCIFILLLLNTIIYVFQIDITKNKENSLSPYSSELLANLSEPITITYIYSDNLMMSNPESKNIYDYLKLYANKSDYITIYKKSVDKNEQLKSKLADLNIQGQKFETSTNTSQTISSYYSSIIIETKDKTKSIPFILSTKGLEYLMALKLQELTNNKEFSVLIKIGNKLSIEENYKYLIDWLDSAGIKPYLLENTSMLENLDNTIPLIILGSSEFSKDDCYHIEKTIQDLRPVLIFTSKNNINIQESWENVVLQDNLIETMKHWGIFIGDEFVLQKGFNLNMENNNNPDEYLQIPYNFWIKTDAGYLYWPNTLYPNKDVNYSILIESNSESYLSTNPDTSPFAKNNDYVNPKTIQKYILGINVKGSLKSFYQTKPISKCRVVIIADQFMLSNMITYTNSISNLDFITDQILMINDNTDLVNLKNKTKEDFSVNFQKITSLSKKILFILTFMWIAMILLTIVLFTKKKFIIESAKKIKG